MYKKSCDQITADNVTHFPQWPQIKSKPHQLWKWPGGFFQNLHFPNLEQSTEKHELCIQFFNLLQFQHFLCILPDYWKITTTLLTTTQWCVFNNDNLLGIDFFKSWPTARSIDIVPRGGPPFWLMKSRGGPPFGLWNLVADPLWLMNSRGGPLLGGCMLMNSRGVPLLGGCMLMNSRGGHHFGELYVDEF